MLIGNWILVKGYRVILIGFLLVSLCSWAKNDTVFVSGNIQHDGLFPTTDASSMRSNPRESWAKIDHLSNTYVDLSVHYLNDSNRVGFKGLRASTRGELTKWSLPGYEHDFGGYARSQWAMCMVSLVPDLF